MTHILVILETRDGVLRPASLEAVGAARIAADGLGGGTVTALACETFLADASSLGNAGADKVLIASATEHSADGAALTAARVAKELEASAVFLSATVRGKDLCGRLAAALESGFAADCTSAHTNGGSLSFTRPIYGGKALQTIQVNGPVVVASLRPNYFSSAERGGEAVVEETSAESGKGRVVEIAAKEGGRPDVAEANRVVSGGRGMGGESAWHLLEAVSDALPGSALGASRAVVDSGWRPHSEQVGQTGKVVAPELYIACGISGAIQHLAGMNGSQCIVAINKDADAPIFQHATYGIVGDVADILPVLAKELAKVTE